MEPQVKKEHYFRKKYDDLNRFISYFYQIDLAQQVAKHNANHAKNDANDAKISQNSHVFSPSSHYDFKILEVGKGNGTVSDYLKKLGYNLTTVDIDPALKPEIVADVRKLPLNDSQFDLVMACEVLEHLPFEDFEKALSELSRVSKKNVLISLPYRSTGLELVLKFPLVRTIFRLPFLDFFLRLPLRFGGIKVSGQHYWEIDCRKYSLGRVKKIIKRHFKIIKAVRPVLNHYHQFFVLEKL